MKTVGKVTMLVGKSVLIKNLWNNFFSESESVLNDGVLLFFFQHLLERHILDTMHCEKNLCENIVKTLLGMHDSLGSRLDAEEMGIREEIWLQPPQRERDQYYMPHPPCVMSASERREFVAIISNIRTPSNYVGSIHKRLVDGKLQYMKTHDYHVLMQQVNVEIHHKMLSTNLGELAYAHPIKICYYLST